MDFALDSGYVLCVIMHSLNKYIAGIAQLVEHNLAKVGVASSSLVSRSSYAYVVQVLLIYYTSYVFYAIAKIWRGSRVVMQRIANPWTPVRFRPPPPRMMVPVFSWLFISRDGETGRRKGLKIPREFHSRAGSIPARGTIVILPTTPYYSIQNIPNINL